MVRLIHETTSCLCVNTVNDSRNISRTEHYLNQSHFIFMWLFRWFYNQTSMLHSNWPHMSKHSTTGSTWRPAVAQLASFSLVSAPRTGPSVIFYRLTTRWQALKLLLVQSQDFMSLFKMFFYLIILYLFDVFLYIFGVFFHTVLHCLSTAASFHTLTLHDFSVQ